MQDSDQCLGKKMDFLESINARGLIHLWGESGSGKTLFAIYLTAIRSRGSHVIWVNTDLKLSFVELLKSYVKYYDGNPKNISILTAKDNTEAYQKVSNVERYLTSTTSLVVIDPITRVLDMARRDSHIWGREIIEDILPSLAGIVDQKKISILCISECRSINSEGPLPVFHDVIKKWAHSEFRLIRPYGNYQTEIVDALSNQKIASQELDRNGFYYTSLLENSNIEGEETACSEEQSFV